MRSHNSACHSRPRVRSIVNKWHWLVVAAFVAATTAAFSWGAVPTRAEEIHPPPAESNDNRIVDGSAEGLSGWQGSGFLIDQSWQAAYPATFWPPFWEGPEGPVFEASAGGASITQTDSLSDLASSIDAGTQSLWAEGDFGGSGSGADGAYMTVELLNGAGEVVGKTYQYGPPSPNDRLNSTIMVPCRSPITVSPGARTARITLHTEESAGQPSSATADQLGLRSEPLAIPAIGFSEPRIPGTYVRMDETGGQGPNCGHAELFTVSGPSPKPTELSEAGHEAPAMPARLSDVKLSRSLLTLRVSSPTKINVAITSLPAGGRKRHNSARRAARRVINLTLTAHTAGKLVHRLRPSLSAGRYLLKLSIASGTTPSSVARMISIH